MALNRRELLASTAALALLPAAASARMGGVAAPVAPPGAVTTFQVKNTSGGSLATPRISIAQPFAPGDVPSGSHIELRANDDVTVIASQQDQESTWTQDGSYKVAAISFVSPDTFSTNQIITYQIWSVSGAPTRAPVATLANVAANSDIKAHFTGQTLSTDVFEVGVNDIITNGTNWPWGANPMQGWEVVRVGPICCEWRFWGYLKRTSDDAFHKWLKGWVYVRSWGSAGPYEIAWGVRAANIETTNGTVGGASNATNVFDTVLLNGATTLQAWGGSGDPRVTTVSSTLFNTTTHTVDLTTESLFSGFSSAAGGMALTLSGTVGTGLSTSTLYWPSANLGNRSVMRFALSRADMTTLYYSAGSWTALHAYGVSETVLNGNIFYKCITAGTSAASGGPTGDSSNITDGTVHWACIIAVWTTQGSGTITITPHCQCFPFTGQIYLDQNAHRLWSGATRPDYEMAHDFTYLTTQSRALPPYIATGISPTADATLYKASPGNEYFAWNINAGGDPVGDDRIGWLMGTEAKILYLPFNVTQHQNTRVIALTFAEEHIYLEDEAVGKPPVLNNGHLRNGVTYTNLGVCRPLARPGPFAQDSAYNNPLLLPGGEDGFYEAYNVWMDSSHGPMPGFLSYLKTGDDLYREYMFHLGGMNVSNQAFFRQLQIGSILYRRLVADPAAQARGVGWATRWFGNTKHLMPATDPLIEYWTDVNNEQALFMDAWRQNVDSVSNPGGVYPGLVGVSTAQTPFGWFTLQPTTPGPVFWHNDIQFFCMAMEAWRGEIPEWESFLTNYMYKHCLNRVDEDPAINGCMYMASITYQNIWDDYPTDSVYPADWGGAWANVAAFWRNVEGIPPPNIPFPWACPSSGMFEGSCCGGDTINIPNSYPCMLTMALALYTILAPSSHAAALYAQARAIQYAYSPPLSFDADVSFAVGPIGATG